MTQNTLGKSAGLAALLLTAVQRGVSHEDPREILPENPYFYVLTLQQRA